ADGQGEGRIEHGVEDVHEGDMRDDDAKQARPQVAYGAHQKPSRAASFDHQAVSGSVMVGDEMLGGSDEVREGIHLVLHSPCVVPGLAESAAAADVCDSVGESAVE